MIKIQKNNHWSTEKKYPYMLEINSTVQYMTKKAVVELERKLKFVTGDDCPHCSSGLYPYYDDDRYLQTSECKRCDGTGKLFNRK